jgi:hypothetical protein
MGRGSQTAYCEVVYEVGQIKETRGCERVGSEVDEALIGVSAHLEDQVRCETDHR